MLKLLTNRRY